MHCGPWRRSSSPNRGLSRTVIALITRVLHPNLFTLLSRLEDAFNKSCHVLRLSQPASFRDQDLEPFLLTPPPSTKEQERRRQNVAKFKCFVKFPQRTISELKAAAVFTSLLLVTNWHFFLFYCCPQGGSCLAAMLRRQRRRPMTV